GSDHDVMEMCERILSNNTQVTHAFEAGHRKELTRSQLTYNARSQSGSAPAEKVGIREHGLSGALSIGISRLSGTDMVRSVVVQCYIGIRYTVSRDKQPV